MDEFGLIRRYFAHAGGAPGVIAGVGDDGAILAPTPGMVQVQVVDTLVEGVHFLSNIPAVDLGYRVVAVNLSDIAAMGAVPRWMTLALTLWDRDEPWVSEFAGGLFEAADEFDVQLVGGDTTQGDAVVISVNVTGEVEPQKALLRRGARAGDSVYVTGTLGDAGGGLILARDGTSDHSLVRRFNRPTPRVGIGRAIAGRASACIDVSDGLAGDLAKLCEASAVGAVVDIGKLPISEALQAEFGDRATDLALTGGDDYELCFTASDADVAGIDGITAIGRITEGGTVAFERDSVAVDVDLGGYRHFV